MPKKFEIEVIKNRKVTETIYKKNPDRAVDGVNFLVEKVERVIPESYMVYFPGKHAVWFETKAQMVKAGIVEDENFEIDDHGLPVEPERIQSLKAAAINAVTPSRAATRGG